MRLFASLSKVEDQEDGSIKVHGIASSGARDEAGEIILPAAMKDALPDYMKWGAIREMHGQSAAGTALECDVDADGCTQLVAHVVDPVAVSKVKAGVYKGFSIGGKVLARDPNDRTIITRIRLVETSLVDRPCNPEAAISMWKADIADPRGADMTDQAEAVAAYAPTNEEVRAEAEAMAKSAGKPGRFADYVVKARETLIARGAPVVEQEQSAAAAERPAPVETAEAPVVEKADPASALGDALARAAQSVAAAEAPTAVTPGLADLGKGLAKLGELYGADPLAKQFYGISALAEAVSTLCSVQSMAASEATYARGGDTQAPQMLAEASQTAGQALLQYVKETLADAMAGMQANGAELVLEPVEGDDAIALAAAAVDLVRADTALMEKAGKRNSASDQSMIQASHDHMAKLGASCDPDNCPEATKAAGAALQADHDRLAKALTDAVPQIEALTKRLDAQAEEIVKLKATPMPPKTAGSSHAVEKVADAAGAPVEKGGPDAADVTAWLASLSPEDRAHELMKATLARPLAVA